MGEASFPRLVSAGMKLCPSVEVFSMRMWVVLHESRLLPAVIAGTVSTRFSTAMGMLTAALERANGNSSSTPTLHEVYVLAFLRLTAGCFYILYGITSLRSALSNEVLEGLSGMRVQR